MEYVYFVLNIKSPRQHNCCRGTFLAEQHECIRYLPQTEAAAEGNEDSRGIDSNHIIVDEAHPAVGEAVHPCASSAMQGSRPVTAFRTPNPMQGQNNEHDRDQQQPPPSPHVGTVVVHHRHKSDNDQARNHSASVDDAIDNRNNGQAHQEPREPHLVDHENPHHRNLQNLLLQKQWTRNGHTILGLEQKLRQLIQQKHQKFSHPVHLSFQLKLSRILMLTLR